MIKTEELLFNACEAIATSFSIPIKFPNRNGPQGAATWLEIIHIPNGVAKTGLQDLKINMGLLNIGINCTPDQGSTVAGPIAEAIKAAFAQGTVLFGTGIKVEIYYPPSVGALIEDGQKAFYPVSIRYRSFED